MGSVIEGEDLPLRKAAGEDSWQRQSRPHPRKCCTASCNSWWSAGVRLLLALPLPLQQLLAPLWRAESASFEERLAV